MITDEQHSFDVGFELGIFNTKGSNHSKQLILDSFWNRSKR